MEDYDYLFKIVLIGNAGVGKTCLVRRFTQVCISLGSWMSSGLLNYTRPHKGHFSVFFFFFKGLFPPGQGATIGVDFMIKTVEIKGEKVKVCISSSCFRPTTYTVCLQKNNNKVDGKLIVSNLHLQLQIWDTAGQERFRSITQSYYRSANALILTYDITCEDSFRCLPEWLREIEQYANNHVVTILVGKQTLFSEGYFVWRFMPTDRVVVDSLKFVSLVFYLSFARYKLKIWLPAL